MTGFNTGGEERGVSDQGGHVHTHNEMPPPMEDTKPEGGPDGKKKGDPPSGEGKILKSSSLPARQGRNTLVMEN